MTMASKEFEIVQKYDINEHIKFIVGVMGHADHETWSLSAVLESISYHMPSTFDYSPEYFLQRFARFLDKNDVIENPTSDEVHALSARIIANNGRNYLMLDLIKAFQLIVSTWEIRAGTLE